MIAGAVVLGSLSLSACERTNQTTNKEDEGVVVERDSVPTEYEVTETVVEYDTTKRTKTVEADRDKDDKDKDDREKD
ncbi:hypothetical protein [Pontibacter ruber]|uniref:Secreted protein n=1 Tax=Pontibacter ruber TaxID=1343895 RepID=A0ABW5CTJ3_9BACT|nr:hypothetical protein [Pontibacter ruber]